MAEIMQRKLSREIRSKRERKGKQREKKTNRETGLNSTLDNIILNKHVDLELPIINE